MKNNEDEVSPSFELENQERAAQSLGAMDFTDHGGTVHAHHVSEGNDAVEMVDTESFSQLGAGLHLRTQSLPILDNLVSLHLQPDGMTTDYWLSGYANPEHSGKIYVPRNYRHCYDSRVRAWTSLRDPEVFVRSHEKDLLHSRPFPESLRTWYD